MQVAIVKCSSYNYENVKKAIEKSLNLIGKINFANKNEKILLKVNLLSAADKDLAITTHPTFVKSVAEFFLQKNAEVVIGEMSGIATDTRKAFKVSGIEEVAKELGIKTIAFDKVEWQKVSINGEILKEILLPKIVIESKVVSLPKLKNHSLTLLTGAVKNLYGAIPMQLRKEGHCRSVDEFSELLLDIYSAIKPKLAIMDGIVGMEGSGPAHGVPKNANVVLASYDCIALDTVASAIVGYKEGQILITKKGEKRKLGIGSLRKIEILGEKLDDVKIANWKKVRGVPYVPKGLARVVAKFIYSRPELIKDKCTKCKECVKHCPIDAIEINDYPKIDRKKCLLCYTCQEICPKGAWYLKESLLFKMIKRIGY